MFSKVEQILNEIQSKTPIHTFFYDFATIDNNDVLMIIASLTKSTTTIDNIINEIKHLRIKPLKIHYEYPHKLILFFPLNP